MSNPESDSTGTDSTTTNHGLYSPFSSNWTLLLVGAFTLLLAVDPAAATSTGEGLCGTEGAQTLINGFIQTIFVLGLIGGFITWQGTNLMGMLSFGQAAKKKVKENQSSLAKYSAMFIAGPILFKFAMGNMGIALASCLDLVPYV